MDPYTNPYGQKSANNTYINPYSPGASNSDMSVDELLAIAQAQGGKIGQIATELSGGNKTMLSTIGKGFKNTFNDFVDVISMPGQVVAGMISPEFTVKEAISENKRVSDAIFGDSNIFNKDGDPTTMQKIGDFIVRLPTDILTDPLTYLTFGASRTVGVLGKMGFGSNSKVSVYKNAAEQLGVAIDDGDVISRALSDYGQEVLGYGKRYEEAIKSGTKTAALSTKEAKQSLIQKGINKEILEMIENNTKTLLNETIDKNFDIDVAKKVISNIMEKSPALAKEFIDGGGMKYFGKTILEGQRIGALISVIPGVKKLDYATQPFRQSVQAMFDSGLVKVGQGYVRVPEEMIRFNSNLQSLMERKSVDFVKNMHDVQRQFNLEKNELDILVNSLNTSTLPNDPRLDAAYYKMFGIRESMLNQMRESGVNVSRMDNHVGLISVPNDTKDFRGNNQFAKKVGATQQAQNIAAIPLKTAEEIQAIPEVQNILSKIDPKQNADVIDNIKNSRSIEEVRDAIGRKRDEIVQNLEASGKTLDEAINDKSVKELNDLQSIVAKMETAGKLVGVKETAKLKGLSDDVLEMLGDDVDSINLLMDEDKNIYKRVATTAQELRSHGIEGFDENLLTAWTVRGLQNIRQGLGKEFSEGLVRNFGRWSDEAPESWVTMSSALVNDEAKNLARGFIRSDGVEMKFHPAVAKVFDDMVAGFGKQDDQIANFYKGYDKLQSYYKSYLTTLFPMFHGRNAISNVLLNFLDIGMKSLDPARHGMSADLIMKDRKINNLMRKAAGTGPEAQKAMEEITAINNTKMFTDRIGHEWSYGELRSVIRDNNIAFNPNLTGAIDVRNDRDELAKMFGIGETKKQRLSKMANPLNADKFAPTQFGRGLGRVIEEQSRLINFMTNLIDTGDVSHATARTKQFLFDYQYGLTKFEKDVMRRIIPFYSFTRFNLELQAKMLMSAPGKIATEIKAVQSLGSLLNGEPMTEEERKLLPPWMANQLNIKRRKKDGTYEIISGFGTPIEQPFQQFSKSGLMGSVSPLIKIIVEKSTGYDLFRGKMTSDVIDAKAFRDAPQPIKNLIGYIEYEGKRKDGTIYTAHVALRPEAMHSILSTPYSRFVSTYSSVTDLDVSKGMRGLQLLTGIRAYSYDEVLLQQRKEDEMIRAMEKLLKDAGIRGQFTRGYNRTNTTLIEN
jgi:hypothetical protein